LSVRRHAQGRVAERPGSGLPSHRYDLHYGKSRGRSLFLSLCMYVSNENKSLRQDNAPPTRRNSDLSLRRKSAQERDTPYSRPPKVTCSFSINYGLLYYVRIMVHRIDGIMTIFHYCHS